MKASSISKAPSLYIDYIRDRLKVKFGASNSFIYNQDVVSDIVSAFHGFKSFEAFMRAVNSFKGFEVYRVDKVKVLKKTLLQSGFINVYKYLTNFYKKNRFSQEQGDGCTNEISDFIVEKISKFICEIHSFENLTFLDILDVKQSQSQKLPMYVHKEEKTFFHTLDYYSASFIIRSIKLKRAVHVSHVVGYEHCNVDIHNVFADVYGFFDLSSYYSFMKVFKKIIYQNATRLTGKHNCEALPYKANRNRKCVNGLPDLDWRALCELVDVAITQGHLTLSRFLFRFYKHPSSSDRNEMREDFSEYESFIGVRKNINYARMAVI